MSPAPPDEHALPQPPGERWDLLVIGGGVHGAAIARDAALRGLSVMLVEKTDFAAGTSSRSSKLAHGGLRYLEHFEVGLVRESLHERDAILRIAPHLAWPLPFLIPLSGPKPRAGWKVRIGLSLYDLLAGASSLGRHDVISAEEAIEMAPALEGCGMREAARYFDAGMDDARIVVEMVVDAVSLGAACVNHARAIRLVGDGDRITGAVIRRDGAPRAETVEARLTVLACGPWTDRVAPRREGAGPRLALTKGAHVFVRRPIVERAALMLAAPQDGRIFFVIPWKGGSLIGTTDTPFGASADTARPSAADVRYLIKAVNDTLPAAEIDPVEIVTAQAGLRPLMAPEEGDEPGSISRDYHLDATPGLVTVEGGKYTIFRKLAERVVDLASAEALEEDRDAEIAPCETEDRLLPGAVEDFEEFAESQIRTLSRRMPAESAAHLVRRYGARASEVAAIARGHKDLLRPACEEHPHVIAEAIHAARHELARTPADALLRRLALGWWDCGGRRCRPVWEEALAGEMPGDIAKGLDACEAELERDWRAP